MVTPAQATSASRSRSRPWPGAAGTHVAGDPIQIGQAPLKKQYRERLGLGIALAHADLLLRRASIARDCVFRSNVITD
jgi:hypothetical protein